MAEQPGRDGFYLWKREHNTQKQKVTRGINNKCMRAILRLNPAVHSARLRAMFRLTIIIVSLLWASVLLLSWGNASEPQAAQQPQVQVSPGY